MSRYPKPDAAAPVAPDPQAGGRYVRNVDGTLTLVDQTEEGRRRSQRNAADAGAPTAPSATTEQLPE